MSDLVLFSGCGGATDGLVRAGWDIAACVDGWDAACESHKRWHPLIPSIQARVESLPFRGPFRRVWASPSCCHWSTANRTPSRGKRHREYFSLATLGRIAFDDLKAEWLVIENVGGLIWSKEGVEEMADFRAWVRAQGLALSQPKNGVIPSNTLGVAQLRRRVFLIVGPRLVSIRPGSVLLPPAGVGPMLWETERANQGQAIMACEGAKGSWESDTRWPKRAEQRPVLADRGRDPVKDHGFEHIRRASRGVVDASNSSRQCRHRSRSTSGAWSNAKRFRPRNRLDAACVDRVFRMPGPPPWSSKRVGSLRAGVSQGQADRFLGGIGVADTIKRLVLYTAPAWCVACRQLALAGGVGKFRTQHPEIPLEVVDLSDKQDTAQQKRADDAGVKGIPVLLVVEGGEEVRRTTARFSWSVEGILRFWNKEG